MGTVEEPAVIAGLRDVERFAARVPNESWFAAVGEPLTETEREDAEHYVRALGLDELQVASVADWATAGRLANDPGWDQRWWEQEERESTTLKQMLTRDLPEMALLSAQTRVTEAASRIIHGAAAIAASRAGVADQGMTRAAAGAATQACYLMALAMAARAGSSHLFAAKYALFAPGRWPLGVVGGKFHLF